MPGIVQVVLFDVDATLDVYGALKARGVVAGIPSIVMYRQGNLDVFAPDQKLTSAKVGDVDAFFQGILDTIVVRAT
jgi:hypothetical protein